MVEGMVDGRAGLVLHWVAECAASGGESVSNTVLCRVACRRLGVEGASVTLMARPPADAHSGSPRLRQEPVGTSGRNSAWLEELHLTTGEGPSVEAFLSAEAVLVADLAAAAARWPAFVPVALSRQVAAVFAFPVGAGDVPQGVLTLHRASPGELDPQTLSQAWVFTAAAAQLSHADPTQAATVDTGAATERDTVHQAVGVLAVQQGITLQEAYTRLRASAYAQDIPISQLAGQVVTGQVRLPVDPGPRP